MGSLSPLASPSATRAVLEEHGLSTKYSLGQNFLVNDAILQKIIELADVQPTDRVLEVGPGIGTLTIALLKHAAHVTAVERDPDLPPVLADTLAPWADRFTLIQKDALDLTVDDLGISNGLESSGAQQAAAAQSSAASAPAVPTKLVANLPYAVAATVVLDYFERFPSLESATVMVQKEVADRMAAQPGTKNYGGYTVKLRLFAEPAGRFPVGPNNFFPPPRVESAVIRLNRRAVETADGRPVTPELLRAACTMADAAFASRRKTLANSCKTYFAGRGSAHAPASTSGSSDAVGRTVVDALPQLFAHANIDPKRRGETLTLQEFLTLGEALLEVQ